MNTIEQAREAATQMRSIFISEDVSSVQAQKWAEVIDALIAELAKSEASAKMWHDHAIKRTEELDALKSLEGEWMTLSQDDGKKDREIESAPG